MTSSVSTKRSTPELTARGPDGRAIVAQAWVAVKSPRAAKQVTSVDAELQPGRLPK